LGMTAFKAPAFQKSIHYARFLTRPDLPGTSVDTDDTDLSCSKQSDVVGAWSISQASKLFILPVVGIESAASAHFCSSNGVLERNPCPSETFDFSRRFEHTQVPARTDSDECNDDYPARKPIEQHLCNLMRNCEAK